MLALNRAAEMTQMNWKAEPSAMRATMAPATIPTSAAGAMRRSNPMSIESRRKWA